jgi:N utilization substance protein B
MYLQSGKEFDVTEDKQIIQYLFEEILLQDENFLQHTEECFLNWDDDAGLVVDAVREVIEKSKHELKLHLEKVKVKEKMVELAEFGRELFRKTVEHKKEYGALIEPKLKNWDADRLAVLDVILIRMALAEFFEFPSIPTKVTINEYLDIAKEYSTPKSKDFINGILDSLMHDLKSQEKIKKTGRGLL